MPDYLSYEVITAIKRNNVSKLKALQRAGETFLGRDTKGNSPFLLAATSRSVEAFDFLLSVENIIDVVDFRRRTPLIAILRERDSEEFCLKLVENGCDIHLVDGDGNSALHRAIFYKLISVSEALIERGADINCQNRAGETPLYIACQMHLVDEVFMLLFYGADPVLVTGCKPNCLDLLATYNNERIQTFFYEKLYPHYKTVNLDTFKDLMEYSWLRFSRLIENTDDITFNLDDLEKFSSNIPLYDVKCFKVFVGKFGYIIEKVVDTFSLYQIFDCVDDSDYHIGNYFENLYTILDSNVAPRLVQKMKEKNFPVIFHILIVFGRNHERSDTITKFICCLLSHGVDPSAEEIDKIFCHFGYCEFFEIMLHMDMQPVKSNYSLHLMPVLIYGVDMTIEKFLANTTLYNTSTLHNVWGFFSTPALKKYGLSLNQNDITTRIRELPVVPTLVELARNKTRVHIVETFKIKNCRQFYTVLKHLPIARVYQEIIAYKRELYPVQLDRITHN